MVVTLAGERAIIYNPLCLATSSEQGLIINQPIPNESAQVLPYRSDHAFPYTTGVTGAWGREVPFNAFSPQLVSDPLLVPGSQGLFDFSFGTGEV